MVGGGTGATSKVLRLDTSVSNARRPARNAALVAPLCSDPAVVATPLVANELVHKPGAEEQPLSTRKRIEHAVEMFGACMLIVAALAITLFA